MIYEFPGPDEAIRQGDIFSGIPKPSVSLSRISIVTEDDETQAAEWDDLRKSPNPITALVGITPVVAVVITQDCDVVRAPDISLCEIKDFSDVVKVPPPTTPKKWVELLRTQAMANLKWFYLPPEGRLGFDDRRAIDFQSVLRVPRDELERFKHLRLGRLVPVADEHFRERLGEFFRRYPYNEWYPFDKAEFEAYRAGHPQETTIILPYEHQK